MWRSIKSNWQLAIIVMAIAVTILVQLLNWLTDHSNTTVSETLPDSAWKAPSLYYDTITGEERQLVIYGGDIIANTSRYFGPHGSVAAISNGMNCQNCHLNAGKRNWGNNYSAVFSTYPKFRERSGSIETIYKRVSDCFERSLNGSAPDSNGREYKAIFAYIKWLGRDVKKGIKPVGCGIEKLPVLDRAADPVKGKLVFDAKCASCHGANGAGQLNQNENGYIYPPLWGEHSYNIGAGLFRLSNFAGYVKSNMPFNLASHSDPQLTTEEAWDVAAFVNSQPRPTRDLSKDWPDISKKPFDHPFGPYSDNFSEERHKYGPYKPIIALKTK
jgi:thiosulfate dehydrogenase